MIFYIKRTDTGPFLDLDLQPADLNLAGATATFKMRNEYGDVVIAGRPVTIVNETNPPRVRYEWQAGDTANVGVYIGEVNVNLASGQTGTFPNDSYVTIVVFPNI